jgi:hypothetical protein
MVSLTREMIKRRFVESGLGNMGLDGQVLLVEGWV